MGDVIRQIATYVAAARGVRVAEPTREATYKCVLDLLGSAAAALRERGPAAVRRTALQSFGSGSVPLWFTGASSSVIGAAWANSAAASALDLDDGHRLARGHPGAAVIPVAFAVAHEMEASLEDLLGAIAIGYEVGVTIAAARRTYGNTGTWASYAAVATAAALRRSSHDVMEHALGIAGESAPNQLFSSATSAKLALEGSDVKEGIPWSVVTGLVALSLAEAGHTGPRNVLDSVDHYRFPEDLCFGSAQHVLHVYFKLYACCRHVHAPLDALRDLMQRHEIDPASIDAIEIDTYSAALRLSNRPDPATLVDIQYSIPYCLALLAIVGPDALLPLADEALGCEASKSLARRVSLSIDARLDDCFPAQTLARAAVVCGQRRYVSEVTAPQGESTQPLSWSALQEKFRAATRRVATVAQQDRLLSAMDVAKAGELAALMNCLSGEVDLKV